MKKYISFIIAAVVVALCSLSFLTNIDNKINDVFIRFTHPLEESEEVVVLLVDDESVEQVGNFPWNRNVYGDSIIFARELGASSVVFDLSFLDPSNRSADPDYIENELPGYLDMQFEEINENVNSIIDGFAEDMFGAEDAEDVKEMFAQSNENVKGQIKTSVSYVVTDNDAYLGNCLKVFDHSFLTLSFENTSEAELIDQKEKIESGEKKSSMDYYYLANNIALRNIDASQDTITPEYNNMLPALDCLLKKAESAGFVNSDPDADGIRRRIHLVYKHDGIYYGQLVFVPLLSRFGNPEVVVTNKSITLKDAKISDTETKDIVIPRCEDGSVLIKFPKKKFLEYKTTGFWNFYQMKGLEKTLMVNLQTCYDNNLFSVMDTEDDMTPVDYYSAAEYIRGELYEGERPDEDITFDQYLLYRNAFYDLTGKFLHDGYEDLIAEEYGEDGYIIHNLFDEMKNGYDSLVVLRESMRNKINGAMLIAGTSATSTTDYGTILYEENYPNVGVHAAVANMLLAQDFMDDSPWWISIIIAIILCILYAILSKKLSTGKSLIVGGAMLLVAVLGLWGFFALTKIYIGTFVPVVSLFITFVAITIIGFLTASHDKKFITNAFSQCLSKDVVNDIVNNPSSLKLGGISREMTAIFTDIQKFSGFSELLNADELVALLNYYLTPMSDIIMEERGTVDKYEGDAIVALVGAPLEMKDHASRACAAAIKMKKKEVQMNDEIVAFSISDATEIPENLRSAFKKMTKNNRRIFTRIGINSGEMVAGFMGSENKKNYTMMGNNVNLASRLEGVNKQYSTGGILISEATRNLIGDEFIVRSLDRVQVVNVKTPMRLYELMETAQDADEKLLKYVEYWEKAMSTFESGDYTKALEMFTKCTQAKSDDNVAKYYVTLLEKFFVQGKYPTKDDDFGVAYNAENPEDMDPSWVGTKYEIKGTFTLMQK